MKKPWITALILGQLIITATAIAVYLTVREPAVDGQTAAEETAKPFLFSSGAPPSQPVTRANVGRTGYYDSPEPLQPQSVKWQVNNLGAGNQVIAGEAAYFCTGFGLVAAVDKVTGAERWKFQVPRKIMSDPVIAGDTLYFCFDGIYALNASLGAVKWKYDAPFDSEWTGLIADTSAVYFISGKIVRALDAATGTLLWTYPIASEKHHTDLALADGRLFVGGLGAEDGGTHSLFAVDAKTGQELWRFSSPEGIATTPVVADGTVFISSYQVNRPASDPRTPPPEFGHGAIHALNASDGKEIWSREAADGDLFRLGRPLAVAGGLVLVVRQPYKQEPHGSPGYIQALDASNGDVVWNLEASDVQTSLSVAGKNVYAVMGLWAPGRQPAISHLYAIDAATGKPRWAADTNLTPSASGEISLSDGVIYLSADGLKALS